MVCRLVMFCGSVDVMEEQLLSCRYLHSSPVELRLLKMYLPLNQLTQYIYNKFPFLFFFPPKKTSKIQNQISIKNSCEPGQVAHQDNAREVLARGRGA